ncbi:MAG: hypothetical protein Q8W51_07385 [Candidatus Palauibacterales bacterium]|nr:hypothetical protein [Candidatus Palauibacterales bacterium]
MITSVKNRLDAAQEAAADLLDAMGMDHRLWDRAGRARLAREIAPVDALPSEFRDATVDAVVRTPTHQVAELRIEETDPEHVQAAKKEGRLRYKQVRARLLDGLDEKRVTVQAWRPTYATARVQTLDHGHPVAEATVAGELGHNSQELLDRVYRHVGKARGTRKEFVEYRLPDGSPPGEAFFREVLGSSEVDRIVNDHRFGNGR